MQDGINWYSYANNNPLTTLDPTGLSGQKDSSSEPSVPPKWFNEKLDGSTKEETQKAWNNFKAFSDAEIDANLHNPQAGDSEEERDKIRQNLFNYYQTQQEVIPILFPETIDSPDKLKQSNDSTGNTFSSGDKTAEKQRQADIAYIVNYDEIKYYENLRTSGAAFPTADEIIIFDTFLAAKGLLKVGLKYLASTSAKSLLSELHHIASNKSIAGGFTEAYERIFAKAGMGLKDSENIVELVGHSGAHTIVYKEYVLRILRNATRNLSGEAYKEALKNALRDLKDQLLTNPRLPYNGGL